MTTTRTPEDHEVEVAGLGIHAMRAGDGPPLLVLHRSTGSTGWTPFFDALAEQHDVLVPDLPGYGQSTLPEWAREPRDLAILMLQYLRKQQLSGVTVVGLGLGGFIAAEMATMNPGGLSSLVVVGAAGLRPQTGDIMDQMLMDHTEYARAAFRDDATAERHLGAEVDRSLVTLWQFNRVMTARISWRPYMYNTRLPHLLTEVETPTLAVWGEADRVTPRTIGEQYAAALPHAHLEVVPGAGHAVEIEEPDRVAALVVNHAAQQVASARPVQARSR